MKANEFIVEFPPDLQIKTKGYAGRHLTHFGQEVHNRLNKGFPFPRPRSKFDRRCRLTSFSPSRVVWTVEYSQKAPYLK